MSRRGMRLTTVAMGALLVAGLIGTRAMHAPGTIAGSRAQEGEHEQLVYRHRRGQVTACGVERWSVKTGIDPAARRVSTSHVVSTNIFSLRRLTPPPNLENLPWNQRHAPTETTVFSVSAILLRYKMEADSDYHLVIADTGGRTMIAETPALQCVGSSSPFLSQIASVRQSFTARYHPSPDSWRRVHVPVQVTGVGFFDFKHGQSGVAPNAIELHPVLRITYGKSSSPPPAPAPPPTSGGSGPVSVSARVSDSSPSKYSEVTVIGRITAGGRGVSNVPMSTAWHYKTRTVGCSGTTDSSGTARCSRNIGGATAGYTIRIDVSFAYRGKTYSTGTSFTPR